MKQAMCIAAGWYNPVTGKAERFGPKRNEVVNILSEGQNPGYWVISEYSRDPISGDVKQFAKAAFIILPDMDADEMQELEQHYSFEPA